MASTKRKMQQVSFRNVEEFLEYLPEDELKIVTVLRKLALQCIPECREKLAYNVPYYHRHSRICFIWPGSIGWGKKQYSGVRLGFERGHLMTDEYHLLDRGTRKFVYWKDFLSVAEIDTEVISSYLYEAVHLDELIAKR